MFFISLNKSEKEIRQKEWLELCDYIHKEILQYDKKMKFPKFAVYRLKGLAEGNFMANKAIKPNGEYDFKTILYTFKICKSKIMQGFKANQTKFNNEQHKFNYAMVVIENEINDVVLRLKRAKKAEKKTIDIELENQLHESADYKRRTKDNKSKILNDLW